MRAKLEGACAGQNRITEGKMTYGWSVQDPKTVLVLYSWDSPEVCDRLLHGFCACIYLFRLTSSMRNLLLDLKMRKS